MAGFPKKYVYTTGNPNSTAEDLPAGVGIAIKVGGTDGATKEQIEAYKAAHPNNPLIVWAAPVENGDYTTTLRDANNVAMQVGAVGLIAQGESSDQTLTAQALTNEITLPKVIVTDHATVGKWPPGWGVDFEYYANDPEKGLNPQNLFDFLKAVSSQGATSIHVTMGSYAGMTLTMDQYQKAVDYLKSQGMNVESLGIYLWNEMTSEQKDGFVQALGLPAEAVSSPTPTDTTPAAAGTPPGHGGSNSGHSAPQSHTSSNQYAMPPPNPRDEMAHLPPAPPYTGGAPVAKVLHPPDGSTVTITSTGAVIKQGRSGTAYREGWVDPKDIDNITNDNLKDHIKSGVGPDKSSPFAAHPDSSQPAPISNDPNQPAWHQNPNWRQPTDEELAWIKNHPNFDASQVLEVRPSEDGSGNLILRLSDGSYVEINHENTAMPLVGNWNNGEWPDYQKGAQVAAPEPKPQDEANPTEGAVIEGPVGSGNSPGAVTEWNIPVIDSALESIGDSDPEAQTILKKAKHAIRNPGGSGSSDNGSGGDSGGSSGGATDPMAVTIAAGRTSYEAPATHIDFTPGPSAEQQSPSCFIAGSKVMTPDGEKAIEEIKLGDSVLTWNMAKNASETTQVTDLLAHHNRHTIVVETEDGKKVTTTIEHPFWTGSEWLPAGHLKANESMLVDSNGQPKKVTAISDGPQANVYNFHVAAPAHNYFVEGLLVHNLKATGM